MGIQDINTVLKKNCPNAYFSMPITYLSGKRVAIDTFLWMGSNKSTARKKVIYNTNSQLQEPDEAAMRKELFLAAINFATKWLNFNITPVFVFDGEPRPEKEACRAERKQKRASSKDKIDVLQEKVTQGIATSQDLEELKKSIRNYTHITSEDVKGLYDLLVGMGLPVVFAPHDGEQLCSCLCRDQKVAAIYTKDADALGFACPLTITDISTSYTYDNYGNRVPYLNCVRYDTILRELNFTREVFTDLCIMSGCDFNDNIPGIAATTALKLLKTHGSIDKLPAKTDITCLKHIRSREIFLENQTTSCDLVVKKIDYRILHEFLTSRGLQSETLSIMGAYANLSSVSDGYPAMLNITPEPPKFLTLVVQS